eukprot:5954312-Pyramimonas_sp.AAC.1
MADARVRKAGTRTSCPQISTGPEQPRRRGIKARGGPGAGQVRDDITNNLHHKECTTLVVQRLH